MLNKKTLAQAQNAKRKKGFTLTEIAIVLGIMGLILGAIWTAASGVYNNQRITHANTIIMQIAQGTRTLYATSNSFAAAADITGNLITANVIPADIANVGAGTATDPWAGGLTNVIVPAGLDSFTIQMTAVPKAPCISLLSTVGGTARDPGLFAVASTTANAPVGAATAGTALVTAAGQIAQVTPAAAANACTSANSNVVQFGFSLK